MFKILIKTGIISAYIDDLESSILLFFNQQPNIYYSNYDNVYVGQSMTVFARVRNHLTGHGNGDVYAEVKYNAPCGEQIFVIFVPCDAKDLNDKEKELIKQFKKPGGNSRLLLSEMKAENLTMYV